MNSWFRSALLAAAVLTAGTFSLRAVTVGEPAPNFTLTDIDGRTHSLADYRGKTVVLEWINPDCPFVRKHYGSGNLPRLQHAAMADGAIWLLINSGHPGAEGDYSAKEAAAWLARMNSAPTAYFRDQDGKVGRLYSAKTTPHLFIINADGVLMYQGAIDSIRSANVEDIAKATNYVTATLAAMKAGRPVAKPTSQPYGCSVKY